MDSHVGRHICNLYSDCPATCSDSRPQGNNSYIGTPISSWSPCSSGLALFYIEDSEHLCKKKIMEMTGRAPFHKYSSAASIYSLSLSSKYELILKVVSVFSFCKKLHLDYCHSLHLANISVSDSQQCII